MKIKRTVESIMRMIFDRLDSESTVYIDEYYRWYELEVVIDIISLEDADEISPFYLMELNGKTFINEEGINHALLYFDNHFKEEMITLLSREPMTDIKDYSVYMASGMKDNMRELGLMLNDDNVVVTKNKEEKEIIDKCHMFIHEYTQDVKRPRRYYKKRAMKNHC